MSPRHNKSVTLIETLIVLVLLGLVILGFSSIDIFSRHQVTSADRHARLQSDSFYVLEHMTKNVYWFVPAQPISISHAKLAATLYKNNKLIVLPENDKDWIFSYRPFIHKNIHIFKCEGKPSDRNNSGIGMYIRDSEYRTILLPADAGYDYLGKVRNWAYVGVVASHHGGKSIGRPPAANLPATAVYSYGKANSFGHPYPCNIANHANSGWKNHPSTAKRSETLGRGNITLKFT